VHTHEHLAGPRLGVRVLLDEDLLLADRGGTHGRKAIGIAVGCPGVGVVTVTVESDIAASAQRVIGLLSDYVDTRPLIKPVAMTEYELREGGEGAGTRYTTTLTAGRRERPLDMHVSAPTSLSLEEADANSTLRTTFTVTERGGGSHVRIATTWKGASGVAGFFERTFAPMGLRPIYLEMLERLNFAATGKSSH
jgi:hypothetical protein